MGGLSTQRKQSWELPTQDERGDMAMDNYQAIVDFFTKAEKPVKAGEVADVTGIDKKEVDKVLAKLKKEGKIVSPKRCFWEAQK
jgi:DNA replicative helicase MCM subunit Mcm2 (Cdc46/Mcm family)